MGRKFFEHPSQTSRIGLPASIPCEAVLFAGGVFAGVGAGAGAVADKFAVFVAGGDETTSGVIAGHFAAIT
jgi:hypothetical protein